MGERIRHVSKEVLSMCLKKRFLIVMLAVTLIMSLAGPSLASSQKPSIEDPAGAMAVDLLFIRPVGIAATIVGGALFIVSLPCSALGGNVGEAGQRLVVDPALFTFDRPLGQLDTLGY
jgi:hypothetical protein